jgi:hypothetical protein
MNWSYFILDCLSLDEEDRISEKFTGIDRRKLEFDQ